MPDITLVEAVTQALAYELKHDENVVVFGEDVGKNGGVFRATAGLQAQFGERRVFDSPLAESMIKTRSRISIHGIYLSCDEPNYFPCCPFSE